MVIVLFLFIILLFPIKFRVNVKADINNAYFCIDFFFYKLLIVQIRIIDYDKMLYFTISRLRPKKIKFQQQDKKVNIPINYDFFRGERVKVDLLFGSVGSPTQMIGVFLLRIFLPNITQIIDDRLQFSVGVNFIQKGVKMFAHVTLFTSIGIVILAFVKKALKGVKYATHKSN